MLRLTPLLIAFLLSAPVLAADPPNAQPPAPTAAQLREKVDQLARPLLDGERVMGMIVGVIVG
ncbi:MAG: hypothetical protein R3336_07305, partial [Phycisphaeraceae bacterium]|nr:hypothetical protein [Phycisphaeraceae bacterium]